MISNNQSPLIKNHEPSRNRANAIIKTLLAINCINKKNQEWLLWWVGKIFSAKQRTMSILELNLQATCVELHIVMLFFLVLISITYFLINNVIRNSVKFTVSSCYQLHQQIKVWLHRWVGTILCIFKTTNNEHYFFLHTAHTRWAISITLFYFNFLEIWTTIFIDNGIQFLNFIIVL